ncbi:shikimate kinase [Sulfurospirillum sp. T05]|uniref:Shikimate kinase n=1 Tax=Sulfurospirillum tamanense TaxID=2813362 RepID=A0ABS2WU46_9BACT|nr:shikimate kinase [Sulfurospirillum tamanensis]MBN2965166.1 shikimate kinase [Sulfurospirillum tamanensis]
MKNIILIGFMGVGKGTIARAFCAHMEMVGLDTDDIIESMENRSIKEVFAAQGEAYFRAKESQVASWLSKHVKNTLISTGGGFFMVENLNKIGTVVYLKSSFEGILERILTHPNAEQKLAKRPLFADKEKAKALFDKRAPLYEKKADIVLHVEGKSIQDIVKELKKRLKR